MCEHEDPKPFGHKAFLQDERLRQLDSLRPEAARPTGPDVPKMLTPRTEAEWREEFVKWARGAFTEEQCRQVSGGIFWNIEVAKRWGAWLAALRLVGAIKEDGK